MLNVAFEDEVNYRKISDLINIFTPEAKLNRRQRTILRAPKEPSGRYQNISAISEPKYL